MSDHFNELVVVHRSTSRPESEENALVLRAAGIPHQVSESPEGIALMVRPADAETSRSELDAYAREKADAAQEVPLDVTLTDGWSGVFCYAIVLLGVGVLAQRGALGFNWINAGKTHAGLMLEGQWWRAVTALTLHSDFAHLLANLSLGGVLGLFAARALGTGAAWLITLVAGAVGNMFNALLRAPSHTSIGASTAVFGILGILAVRAWKDRRSKKTRMDRWVPVIGGVILLGYLGTGGERTDVTAHVFGFLSGMMMAVLTCDWCARNAAAGRQSALGAAALILLAASWFLAGHAAMRAV